MTEEVVHDWFETAAKIYDLIDYVGRCRVVEWNWRAVELVFSGYLTIVIRRPNTGSDIRDIVWWGIGDPFMNMDPNGDLVPGEDAHVGIPHFVGIESEGHPLEPAPVVAEYSGSGVGVLRVGFTEVGRHPGEVSGELGGNAIGYCSPELPVGCVHRGPDNHPVIRNSFPSSYTNRRVGFPFMIMVEFEIVVSACFPTAISPMADAVRSGVSDTITRSNPDSGVWMTTTASDGPV